MENESVKTKSDEEIYDEKTKNSVKEKIRRYKKGNQLATYTTIIHFLQEAIYTFQKAGKDYPFLETNEIKQAQTEVLVALTIISELINKKCVTKEWLTKFTRVSHACF